MVDHTLAPLLSASTFTWLGMVVAISFIEAPLKFRAPGVTVPIGLGIGRLVFRALNIAEIVLAICLLATVALGRPAMSSTAFAVVAVVLLVIQLSAVRPRLNRRSDRVLAGAGEGSPARSHAHLAYVVTEVLKVAGLLAVGVSTLIG